MLLETQRLVLRPLVLADAPAIQKHFPHWDIVKYLTKEVPWPYPPDGARQFLEKAALPGMARGEDWLWGIVIKAETSGEAVGVVHVRRDDRCGNRGFWLAREHHGKGYMTEAVAAVNDYVFGALGFKRLVIKNAQENAGSRRVKEKTGAIFLRTEPGGHYHGDFALSEVWEITPESWAQAKLK